MNEKNDRIKVLMLSDHSLSTSGVGTQSRWLISGLLSTGKYTFRQLGGAVKHESYSTVTVNEHFIIKPVDGFGNRDMIRQILATERPDVLLLFTDPRFFVWCWEMEDEIHQVCPIAYWHLWDNPPWPEFNRVLYESTDLINCINWPTYEMVSERFPDRTNFIPHAIPREIFHPLPAEERVKQRTSLLGPDRSDHFVALWVSRNARRKAPADVIVSWKMFIDGLHKKYGHTRATLIMHTDPHDPEGPNLHHVCDVTGTKEHVVFSKNKLGFPEMNVLYNVSDCVVSRSINEGFGLSLLEGMQSGVPLIALKTGGQTRQVVDHRTGKANGIALDPEVRSMVGNQHIPYILEDYISHETFAKAFMDMYEMGPEERSRLGKAAREYALSEFSMEKMINEWDRTLTDLVNKWKSPDRPKLWETITI